MAIVGLLAQSSPREDLTRGQKFWEQRLARKRRDASVKRQRAAVRGEED